MENIITIQDQTPVLSHRFRADILEVVKQIKVMQDYEKALKTSLMHEMEDKGILKIETDDLSIQYIAPTDREKFNTKGFRKDHGDLYDEYITMTPVKASVRIKVK